MLIPAPIDAANPVRELKLLGFSDIRKVVSWRNELVTRTEKGKDGEPVMVLMPRVTIVDADKISDEAAAAIAEVSQNANGSLRIKMHDKHAALGAANTGAGLKGLRDRALLLIGFAGALRRSELVALNIEDIEEVPDGMKITIRHSKTDQEGAGQTIAIPSGKIACPVAALKEWITAAGIGSGALFRSVNRHGKVGERLTDQSVSDIVKEHAERLRLDPKQFAGHSLRAGFLTSAASRGASIFKMMDVSRHRSVDTLRGYVRDAELFKDHAGAGLL
jgi:site-specific recombinase XerD